MSPNRLLSHKPNGHAGVVDVAARLPPHLFFIVSAVFHYLGPAFAVLLFASVPPLGIAWLRILTAATIFGAWRRPWKVFARLDSSTRWTVVALGIVLGAMNASFYLAISRLPLATVGAIEFLGPIGLAAIAVRGPRNIAALLLAIGGVVLLTEIRFSGAQLGYLFAFTNCGLFVLYIMLGHRLAEEGGGEGIDRLSAAMLVAVVVAAPIGFADAVPAFGNPTLLLAAIGVGISSSVIPYVTDQLAMARLSRGTFALMLSLLPATATAIGFMVLRQTPAITELVGIALVIAGVAVHRPKKEAP
ncbi:EamA family transporter [Agrobacterium rhizogenes]|uniref:EamA domain-containing protein n=1 Tax=Rhizobium rhizogenes NBRC 13257 TaxID=1220581 RepID=A0AA87Q9V5_RHIRH|nr:EamA family transporter [Rhizobium rhizogenes]NTF59275.1 EamA family transporter [Rhizobium rhizogenes]NTF78859.1 EamA family transporter [Rhizobium rhizogenes]NTG64598.1 EamA family transporter [Rhizobium rhizogenes]NTG71181.1 EamA family transporter [Rhizobium rhizogenes]NTG84060.1 EamA family transporter [Rhizobium rhizogenes]